MKIDFHHHSPQIEQDVFVAPTATLIGQVTLASGSSVLFGAVLRGDSNTISIGQHSNVQDLCVLHVDGKHKLSVGEYVSLGHKALLHGCTIGNRVLVGMGAIIMNGVEIGDDCIIAAGALIPEGKKIPSGSLVIGMPGKVAREITAEEKVSIVDNAKLYVQLSKTYSTLLKA